MTDVACFCGCLYSFDGGAGACPKCGEVASVTGPPVQGRPEADPYLSQLLILGLSPGITGGRLFA